jgi:vitamin B12 transporter
MASIKPFADQGFQLRAFYKNIFRYPTFAELYYGVVTNTNLKPESANQYDLGVTYNKSLTGLLEYVALTADGYYNTVNNKIVFQPGFDGAINYGRVDIEGLDAGLKTQADLGSGYKIPLTVNYSYQSALILTDPTASDYLNQLPYIPKNTLAFNIGINKEHIGVYYNQILSSTRYFNNNNDASDYLPPYSISEASVVYKNTFHKFPVMASFGVDNLFNKNYVVVQSYPMPGRSYKLSFQITI